MVTSTETGRGARVFPIPPPIYYAAGLAGGMALNAVVALPLGGRPATLYIGAVVLVLGVLLAASGVAMVIRHRTTIVPHRPVASLVTGGPYRLSRNPMYTALAIVYVGAALLLGSWWPLLLGPVVVAVVRLVVIRPEERYLAERFGPAYADYRARVRRWL
ncbi:methyltransferase family protein [Dactylosporangium sp. NPDC051541]|uniref:methyltransferase family protein n=1 Tax=Dactylosporangium sp. NPDC051541 TaxID=3363977 RepID=UPI0037BA9C0B